MNQNIQSKNISFLDLYFLTDHLSLRKKSYIWCNLVKYLEQYIPIKWLLIQHCTYNNRLETSNKIIWIYFIKILFSIFVWSSTTLRMVGWFMVFNATFTNISVISWKSALLVEETTVPGDRTVASQWYSGTVHTKLLQ
jgi:hypothetical protein